MKKSTCPRLATLGAAFLATATLTHAQTTTASTPVIGFYKFNAPAGNAFISCAFVTKNEFQAQSTSISGAVITQSGANWTTNQFAGTNGAFYVEILDGTQQGLILDIISNTSNTLTVDTNLTAASPSGLGLASSGFKYCIRKHATLETIFPNGGGLEPGEDTVTLYYDNGTRARFKYNPTSNSFTPTVLGSPSKIVYPGQGMLLTCVIGKELTFGGAEVSYVKTTPTKIPLYGNVNNIVGTLNPLVSPNLTLSSANPESQNLGSLGFQAAFEPLEDYVTVMINSGTGYKRLDRYYSNGTNMVTFSGVNSNNIKVPNGSAVIVRPTLDKPNYTLPVTIPQ